MTSYGTLGELADAMNAHLQAHGSELQSAWDAMRAEVERHARAHPDDQRLAGLTLAVIAVKSMILLAQHHGLCAEPFLALVEGAGHSDDAPRLTLLEGGAACESHES